MRGKIIIFLTLCLFPSAVTLAQESIALKIGFVDIDKLMMESTVIRRMVDSVQDEVKKEQENMTDMMTRYKVLTETYEQQKTILTEEQRQTRRKEIDELKIAIDEQQDKVNSIIKRSERRLLEPTLARVDEAIKAVGKEGGYDLILKSDAILYGKESSNITNQVMSMIEKMDKEKPITPLPANESETTTESLILKKTEEMIPIPTPAIPTETKRGISF